MLKAIDTVYKNYKFRSRLEARWAVFFDELGIAWSYEPEGFHLKQVGYYLPDFYIKSLNAFVEIKPVLPSALEKRKAAALAKESESDVIILYGSIGVPEFSKSSLDDFKTPYTAVRFHGNLHHADTYLVTALWDMERNFQENGFSETPGFDGSLKSALILREFELSRNAKKSDPRWIDFENYGIFTDDLLWHLNGNNYDLCHKTYSADFLGENLQKAYLRAQQARFEHGEVPGERTFPEGSNR